MERKGLERGFSGLRALAAHPGAMSSIPSNHLVTHSLLQEDLMPSFVMQAHMQIELSYTLINSQNKNRREEGPNRNVGLERIPLIGRCFVCPISHRATPPPPFSPAAGALPSLILRQSRVAGIKSPLHPVEGSGACGVSRLPDCLSTLPAAMAPVQACGLRPPLPITLS